jgi:hypothetical protein
MEGTLATGPGIPDQVALGSMRWDGGEPLLEAATLEINRSSVDLGVHQPRLRIVDQSVQDEIAAEERHSWS